MWVGMADSICDPFSHAHPPARLFLCRKLEKVGSASTMMTFCCDRKCEGKFFSVWRAVIESMMRLLIFIDCNTTSGQIAHNDHVWSADRISLNLGGGGVRQVSPRGADDKTGRVLWPCASFVIVFPFIALRWLNVIFLLIMVWLDCPFSVMDWLKYLSALLAAATRMNQFTRQMDRLMDRDDMWFENKIARTIAIDFQYLQAEEQGNREMMILKVVVFLVNVFWIFSSQKCFSWRWIN